MDPSFGIGFQSSYQVLRPHLKEFYKQGLRKLFQHFVQTVHHFDTLLQAFSNQPDNQASMNQIGSFVHSFSESLEMTSLSIKFLSQAMLKNLSPNSKLQQDSSASFQPIITINSQSLLLLHSICYNREQVTGKENTIGQKGSASTSAQVISTANSISPEPLLNNVSSNNQNGQFGNRRRSTKQGIPSAASLPSNQLHPTTHQPQPQPRQSLYADDDHLKHSQALDAFEIRTLSVDPGDKGDLETIREHEESQMINGSAITGMGKSALEARKEMKGGAEEVEKSVEPIELFKGKKKVI